MPFSRWTPRGRWRAGIRGRSTSSATARRRSSGATPTIFFTPEDRERGVPQQELKTAAEKGRASDDRWHVRKDGTSFFASGITTGLRDAQGALQGFIKIMRDRTDRKRLEEELHSRAEALARADREKDEFLAMLAHELRNPLAPDLLRPAACSTRAPGGPPALVLRRIVDRQMRRLARLIDDLLDISRIRTGKVELRKERVDAERRRRPRGRDRPPPDRGPRARAGGLAAPGAGLAEGGPRPAWSRCSSNLLSNAAKYTDGRGRIWLSAAPEGREVVVRGAGHRGRHRPRHRCPASSTCSPRRTGRWTAPRAAWGSA